MYVTNTRASLASVLQVGPVTAAAMVAEHGNAILDIMDGPEAVEMLQRWVPACQRDELHSGESSLGRQMHGGRCVIVLHCISACCLVSSLCSLPEPAWAMPDAALNLSPCFGASLSPDTLSMSGCLSLRCPHMSLGPATCLCSSCWEAFLCGNMEALALTAHRCKGIGPKTAVKIKTDWDKRSGERCQLLAVWPAMSMMHLAAAGSRDSVCLVL